MIAAVQSESRYVEQHPNPTLTIQWDWTSIHLRSSDLIALSNALEEKTVAIRCDGSQAYILWLGEDALYLPWYDLLCFRDLVCEARAKLSRDFTRWTDIDIRLESVEQTQSGLCLWCN